MGIRRVIAGGRAWSWPGPPVFIVTIPNTSGSWLAVCLFFANLFGPAFFHGLPAASDTAGPSASSGTVIVMTDLA